MKVNLQEAVVDASRIVLDKQTACWVVFGLGLDEHAAVRFMVFSPELQDDVPELAFDAPQRTATLAEAYEDCTSDGAILMLVQRDLPGRGIPVVATMGYLFPVDVSALPELYDNVVLDALWESVEAMTAQIWPDWLVIEATEPEHEPENSTPEEAAHDQAEPDGAEA